ncbi:thioredoxin-disulfide reductase [Candidatus Pacearchaeota archaeon]|nr:thioredoxin-disulfide reductase [Candidatus Pacearchaeota archaeon]
MNKKEQIHDVIIIGGGIAAYTAALYTARANLKPIILCGVEPDQLSLTTLVENWPGFEDGILGPELIENSKKQAEKFGAKCIQEAAESFSIEKKYFEIKTSENSFKTKTLIIATGASARKLNIPGENKYFGRGVSTCAVCDAALYRNKDAIVIGGGDSAMEESLALYKFAKKVTIIHRRNKFRASKIMQDRIFKLKDKIDIIWDSEVIEVLGNGKSVTGVKIKNLKTNKISEIKTDGIFLAIGHIPNTKIFQGKIKLDNHGYLLTDKLSGTNIPGIYAAGDVQDPVFKQAITSAGTGCQAALQAEKYLEKLKAEGKY